MRLGAGVGFGVSVELAPDVRLHATSRGVRTSVGPQAADPHVGTDRSGLDTDGRPVSYETSGVGAGTDLDSGRYVSCVVTFGYPDLVPNRHVATALTGRPTLKKRSRSDINDLYVAAMGSTVLATVKQALAIAPAADEVRIAVVRNAPATFLSPEGTISVIYAGIFPRHEMESVDWETIDPESELLRARGAELVRRGAARTVVPLDRDAHRRMAAVLDAFSAPEHEDGDWVD